MALVPGGGSSLDAVLSREQEFMLGKLPELRNASEEPEKAFLRLRLISSGLESEQAAAQAEIKALESKLEIDTSATKANESSFVSIVKESRELDSASSQLARNIPALSSAIGALKAAVAARQDKLDELADTVSERLKQEKMYIDARSAACLDESQLRAEVASRLALVQQQIEAAEAEVQAMRSRMTSEQAEDAAELVGSKRSTEALTAAAAALRL